MRNEEVLLGVKEEKNILQSIKRGKANWIGHILLGNCLLNHFIEGKIEGRIKVIGKPGTRLQQSQKDIKDKERLLEIERGNVRSHSAENSLWNGIWTCRKTD